MNIRSLQRGLQYRGRVVGIRQTYHVFEASQYYFVLSFARAKTRTGSGYFNVVNKAAVTYVQTRFARFAHVTARDVRLKAQRTRHVPTSLFALNILYVLVALKQAKIVGQGERRQLVFSLRKG